MGIIKAVAGSISGGLADQWLEVIEPDDMGPNTIMVRGVKVKTKRSSNTKSYDNNVSNGSIIHVYPNQMMFLLDNGKIVDYSAEEGYYQVYLSSAPSMFNGELGEAIKETFGRIKYGGTPSTSQQVYYINLQEIRGIKFGTKNPINYFDSFYNAELFLRCHGTYSVKVTDPLKFFTEAVPRNADKVEMNSINEQYLSEFLTALQAAINQMSVDGVRISTLPSKSMELSKYMSTVLDEDWKNLRGLEIVSVGISSISYDEESKKLINMRNKGAMLSDPTIREGFVQGSVAQGMEAAGSNRAGAGQAFMGIGMGMNAGGGFMQSASETNRMQMQNQQQYQQQAPPPVASGWNCSCGKANNIGKFCSECGNPKPMEASGWECSCGNKNTGKFCSQCGNPQPSSWKCSCGAENSGNFCSGCGNKKPV
ncbi:MAG: virion core protein [Clostridiales bacterium]|nr:virion core protein [Clostridiales bacterium]